MYQSSLLAAKSTFKTNVKSRKWKPQTTRKVLDFHILKLHPNRILEFPKLLLRLMTWRLISELKLKIRWWKVLTVHPLEKIILRVNRPSGTMDSENLLNWHKNHRKIRENVDFAPVEESYQIWKVFQINMKNIYRVFYIWIIYQKH